MKDSKIKKQKLLNPHMKWKKWVWPDPISLQTGLVITKVGGQVKHNTDGCRHVATCQPISTMQCKGLWLGDLLAQRLRAFVSKPAMAPRARACSIQNSPGKIQDLLPVLSGSKVLSDEIAYGLKNSYDLSTKG